MTCQVCHRPLSNPISIERMIGPICAGKKHDFENQKELNFMEAEAIPGFGDVICSRDENGIHTNVPRRITHHSPDGFEWGYGGSGPSDFALNILSCYIGQEEAQKYYQNFKWAFIATMPLEGGVIKKDVILNWLAKQNKIDMEELA